MKYEIAIIGAGGRMGKWFLKYLSIKKENKIYIYDKNPRSIKGAANATVCNNIKDCVKSADLVIVCVPIRATPLAIRSCAKEMKKGAILMEISSIKTDVFKALKKIPNSIKPICIHPMFGPGAKSANKMKIILIPVQNKDKEFETVQELFRGAMIKIVSDPLQHDKCMAIVLGLTYFINLVFASILSEHEEIELLKEISGTTFFLQTILSDSIMTDDPALVSSLLTTNPFIMTAIKKYIDKSNRFEEIIGGKDIKKIESDFTKIKGKIERNRDLYLSYHFLYNIVESIKRN